MTLKRIWLLAFAICTVTLNTACPRDIANAVAEQVDLQKEYDEKSDKASAVDRDLMSHDVYVSSTSPRTVNWSTKSPADRELIRAKLMEYLELMGRVIEISNHKLMKEKVTESMRRLNSQRQQTAGEYLSTLNRFDNR